ncbi:MAG: tRNA (adenosine(37)-N6)-dimethylallyltransferase MiaA [Bacteroidia bacterium]|nr:tRNA (adenosine(37)-N6)-dimethylallyltransferase MiaA [Bacteroidia bacterium]
MRKRLLIVIVGPTGVGKTAVAIKLAQHYGTEIVSADSRQFYKEIPIGTAAPSLEEMQGVVHHFIGHLNVSEPMDAGKWAEQAEKTIESIFQSNDTVICAGGSGLYVNALLGGMDDLPERNDDLRKELEDLFEKDGIAALQDRLRILDPEYCEIVDMNNHKRLIRAIEVCELSGQKYSELRKGKSAQLPYAVVTVGLNMEREELYRRIDARVDIMIEQGLEQEARAVINYRDNNALATVGYREMFSYFDGEISRDRAIELIKQHSRNYAKRQLTWWRRDGEVNWFHPSQVNEIIARCEELRNTAVNH